MSIAPTSNPPRQPPTGLPELSHPPKRSHSFLPLRHHHQPNQPRLRRRSQRHHLPHHLRPLSLLHPIHRLHPLQASAPRTAAIGALVARPRGNGSQYHRTGVLGGFLCVLLLPDGYAGAAGYDELEYCHVWGNLCVGYGLLCGEGEEGIYSARKDCEARCLGGLRGSCESRRRRPTALHTERILVSENLLGA